MARRTNRRSLKRRRNSVNAISVSKALNASKSYVYENRQDTISSTQNYVRYGVLPLVLNAPFAATAQYPTPASVVATAGHEASANVGTDTNYKVRIAKQVVTYKIRNLSNHPCFLTLGNYVSKMDNYDSAYSPAATAVGVLFNGWDKQMVAAQATNTGTGTIVVYTAGQEYLETLASSMVPSQSYDFQQAWQLKKRAVYKMMPGDDIFWSVTAPAYDLQAAVVAGQHAVSLAGKSIMTMYRVHGALGKSTIDDTKVGFTKVDLGYEVLYRCKTYRLQNTERSLPMDVPKIDAALGTLEGPTEHIHYNEDL